MKHFNVAYVKQHPVMFGAIFLVFGVFLYLLLNRSAATEQSSGGGTTTVVNPGPSDAAIQAGAALQAAQLDSNTQIALAQLGIAAHHDDNSAQRDLAGLALTAQMAEIQANYNLGKGQLEASLGALSMQLGNNLAITHDNNSFMLDYAKNAQDSATAQLMIGANLQATLGAQQLDAFKFGTAAQLEQFKFGTTAAIIPTLAKGKRDNAFAVLAGGLTGPDAVAAMQPNGSSNSGSSFNPLKVISPVIGLFG